MDGALQFRTKPVDLDTHRHTVTRTTVCASADTSWAKAPVCVCATLFGGKMRNLAIYDTVDVGGSTVDGWGSSTWTPR